MVKKNTRIKAAVVQAASVPFDIKACINKACKLIEKASSKGSRLILFPEAFIPAYPWGMGFGTVVGNRTPEGRNTWQKYFDNSFDLNGPEIKTLGNAIKKAKAYTAIGVIEKDSSSKGTLYCTLLYFGPDGKLIGKHRKLKPTAQERVIWGEGDGTTLTVIDSKIGRIGGLICWENYMPLARMSMYKYGIQIYLAPTADYRDSWHATLRHIACEGRCFVLGCNQYFTKKMYPKNMTKEIVKDLPEVLCRGGSTIISPLGEVLAGPLYNKEDILYADLDLSEITRAKMDFDVAGHYNKPDIFELNIKGQPEPLRG